ncbi:hypothetical protein BP422_10160 [Brevibacillus formosus]|uniref:Uncharacterized protein n=1 Tax=Brevibacillus formosus TaxID=54913 RepID=A0A220MG21_9BACL|nr:hypothetical protein [Brevibacillus formosus]ASJ53875.1 hypothetical protein BP422_10160 [Brevibacillus formosus]
MSIETKNAPEINHRRQQALKLIEEWIEQEEERFVKSKNENSPTGLIEKCNTLFEKPSDARDTTLKNTKQK